MLCLKNDISKITRTTDIFVVFGIQTSRASSVVFLVPGHEQVATCQALHLFLNNWRQTALFPDFSDTNAVVCAFGSVVDLALKLGNLYLAL